MPSFAKPAVDKSSPLVGLWKDQPDSTPLKDLLQSRRARAVEILGTEMPAKLAHIRKLIESESDPSSSLWTGHTEQGEFIQPRMLQPDQVSRLLQAEGAMTLQQEDLRNGETIILPGEVVRASESLEAGVGETEDENVGGMMHGLKINGNSHVQNGTAQSAAGPVVEKGVRVGPHWFEVVPRNKVQTELIMLTTKEHEDLHALVQDLRVWLELEIPIIEDGNSFGAEVQNHLIRELEAAYKKSNGFINASRQHHTDRLRLITEWIKYPNVMDYPAAIVASDRFDHFISRSYLRSLLMIYGGLLTRFQRNWEKVINPKGTGNSASGGIY